LFINKSVKDGDIDTDVSTEYIKRLIQQGWISDTSVLVVLIGPKTYCRKHVDWEIAAALSKKVGGYSGLIGILLPEYKLSPGNRYRYDDIPSRLADNCKSGYASMYTWDYICSSDLRVKNAVEEAFRNRTQKSTLIDNRRLQLKINRCE
jgi:hypothetical protein